MQSQFRPEPNLIDPKVPSRRSHQAVLGAAAVGAATATLAYANPAQATAVDDLAAEAAKLATITDSVVPVVVGVAILGGGMMLIKRVIFS